jgi:hypothetical protein
MNYILLTTQEIGKSNYMISNSITSKIKTKKKKEIIGNISMIDN